MLGEPEIVTQSGTRRSVREIEAPFDAVEPLLDTQQAAIVEAKVDRRS